MSEITAQRASEVLIYATVPSPPNLDPKIEVECARALDWAREIAQKAARGELVPVVRCKDCKHLETLEAGGTAIGHCDLGERETFGCKPDDFCRYGKRKDGEK